jgi:hypothetical protein
MGIFILVKTFISILMANANAGLVSKIGEKTVLESEAKTKWCPRVEFSCTPDGVLWSNRADNTGKVTCIASECMWWVWDRIERLDGTPSDTKSGHCGAIK